MAHDCNFLADVVPDDRVSFGESARESHAGDWAADQQGTGVTPDAVVWPETTDEVSAVLAAATDHVEPGEWVHTHNAESKRGRGDVAAAEAKQADGANVDGETNQADETDQADEEQEEVA